MPSCAVFNCKNSSRKRPRRFSFYRFPKDENVQEEWLKRCCRSDKFSISAAAICSEHFTPSDLATTALHRRIFKPSRVRLAKDAVPSLKLPHPFSAETLERKEQLEKIERRSLVEKLLLKHTSSPVNVQPPSVVPESARDCSSASWADDFDDTNSDFDDWTTLEEDAEWSGDNGGPVAGEVSHLETRCSESAAGPTSSARPAPPGDSRKRAGFSPAGSRLPGAAPGTDEANGSGESTAASGVRKRFYIVRPRRGPASRIGRQRMERVQAPQTANLFQAAPPAGVLQQHNPREPGTMPAARNAVFVVRAKEILQKRHRINELEDRYRSLLRRQPVSALEPSSAVLDATAGTDAGSISVSHTGKSLTLGSHDDPLAVLRKPPPATTEVIRKLRKRELSATVEIFPPANMQEALDIIHQLRMQNLAMKEDFLKWAIKNKKEAELKDGAAEERLKKTAAKVVKRPRLKELEDLEESVKKIFTESQIRALTSNYSANCAERKKVVHWREEDMRRSLELRAVSSEKVLNYVRHKLQIPLPCMETVKNRFDQFPELNEMYRAILKKTNTEASHCEMCQRQLGTIEAVAGGTPASVTDNADGVSREDRLNVYVDQAYQGTPPTVKISRLKQAVGLQKNGGLGKRGPESEGRFERQRKPRGDEWEDSESSGEEDAEDPVQAIFGFAQYNKLKNWRLREEIGVPASRNSSATRKTWRM